MRQRPLPRLWGRGRRRLAVGPKIPNSTARSEVLAGPACPNMWAEDGFPVAIRRSKMMTALAIRNDEPMRAGRTKGATATFATDEARWEAVKRRDRAADGAFYYSVRTTGVYCRPSCGARLPRRENAAFHKTCADAERAGFRPCKRCRPNEPTLAETHAAVVARACRLIEEAEEAPSLDALAQSAGMSRFHFHRVFKAVTGVTP